MRRGLRRWSLSAIAVGMLMAPAGAATGRAHAQEPPTTVTFGVDALGSAHRLVYLLKAADGRLAAGAADLERWGLMDRVGAPAVVAGVPSSTVARSFSVTLSRIPMDRPEAVFPVSLKAPRIVVLSGTSA